MVAALVQPQQKNANVKLVAEIRGAPAKLWSTTQGEIIISGPAGTGKTRAILEWIHWRCQNERLKVLILRKTLESLKTSALVTYQEQVLHDFDGKRSVYDGVSYFGGNDILPPAFNYSATGSRIVVGGMDQPSKIKSTEWDIVFPNEATELTLNDWEMITGRTDRPTLVEKPPSLVIGDCNPDAPTHWVKRRAKSGELTMWFSRHEDNPAMWDRIKGQWTASGLRYLARLDKMTGVRKQRMRYGKWVAAEGQVFDAWDRTVHVIPRSQLEAFGLAAPKRHIAGVDWGWTKPGVITVAAIGGDGQLGIVREIYRTRKGREWWIAQALELQREFAIDVWVCDPSEPEYIDAFVQAGLNAEGAVNDILPGITAIQDRLSPDENGRIRWVVLEDCNREPDPELLNDDTNPPTSGIDEIDVYVWPKPKTRETTTNAKEKPVDADNHCLIAGTLVETENGAKPIELIKAGERVWTRDGICRVDASGLMNPSVQVYTVRTEDGAVITGSSNHPVWVDGYGWKYLDTLRYGDILRVWNRRRLSSTESHSEDTQSPSDGLTACTSRRTFTIASQGLDDFTKRFGSRFTVSFREVARFITATSIHRTMTSPISFVLPLINIKRSTVSEVQTEPRHQNTSRIWTPFDPKPSNGTEAKRDEIGIARMRRRCGETAFRFQKLASSAATLTKQPQLAAIGFAPMLVSLHGDGHPALTTKTDHAPSVGRHSGSTATRLPVSVPSRVVSVTAEPKKQAVYNLTVAETPEFFANGILVHNSIDTWRYIAMAVLDERVGFEAVPESMARMLEGMGL